MKSFERDKVKYKVVLLRSGSVNPDPPVEKAACELVKAGYAVTVLAWDRDGKYNAAEDELAFKSGKVKIIRLGIPAVYSGGFKKNIIPLIWFEKALVDWLKNNRTEYDIIYWIFTPIAIVDKTRLSVSL